MSTHRSHDVDYRNRRGGPAKGPSVVLGMAGAGLGAAALARPTTVARLVGVREDAATITALRLFGVRELMPAAGLLVRRRPAAWLWARVAGDAADLALLAQGVRTRPRSPQRAAIALGLLGVITVVDFVAAIRVQRASGATGGDRVIRARAAVTINRPIDEVYAYWRQLENLPAFMEHVEQVSPAGDGRSHWQVRGPGGKRVEWDAELIADHPGQLIAWTSVSGADVTNRGSVRFRPAPGNRGTEVLVDLMYEPPAGAAGALIARLFGEEPVQQMKDDLRRLKQVLETGEVTRSEGSPEGTRAARQLRQLPAQPAPPDRRRQPSALMRRS